MFDGAGAAAMEIEGDITLGNDQAGFGMEDHVGSVPIEELDKWFAATDLYIRTMGREMRPFGNLPKLISGIIKGVDISVGTMCGVTGEADNDGFVEHEGLGDDIRETPLLAIFEDEKMPFCPDHFKASLIDECERQIKPT